MMDNDHAMPLDWKCFFHLRRPFVEKVFVHQIFIVRISLLFKQIVICKQCYSKNAKLMSVLKFFFLKMQFSIKQANFYKT